MFENSNILITGGTGSFGRRFTKKLFEAYKPNKGITCSRDDLKQFEIQQEFPKKSHGHGYSPRMRLDVFVNMLNMQAWTKCRTAEFDHGQTQLTELVAINDTLVQRAWYRNGFTPHLIVPYKAKHHPCVIERLPSCQRWTFKDIH